MARSQERTPEQAKFLDNYGKIAPAVPAIRQAVWDWRDSEHKGADDLRHAL